MFWYGENIIYFEFVINLNCLDCYLIVRVKRILRTLHTPVRHFNALKFWWSVKDSLHRQFFMQFVAIYSAFFVALTLQRGAISVWLERVIALISVKRYFKQRFCIGTCTHILQTTMVLFPSISSKSPVIIIALKLQLVYTRDLKLKPEREKIALHQKAPVWTVSQDLWLNI